MFRKAKTLRMLVWLAALLGLLARASIGRTQRAQAHDGPSVEQAERYASQAFEAYSKKEYAQAVALYQKAFEAAPSADILYNIARIYEVGLRDRQLAITFYRRYVADPGAVPERIQSANERLTELRAAEDAATPTPAPSGPNAAPAGSLSPAASPQTGDMHGAAAAGVAPATDSHSSSVLRTAGWLSSAVGVAAIAVGAGFGAAAIKAADTVGKSCNGNLCDSQAGVDAAESGTTKATISTTGFIAGGALLTTGVVLLIMAGQRDQAHADRAGVVRVHPMISLTGAGTAVSGRW